MRGIDEHTKLARAALDFDTDLDSAFHINVAKMRVTIPPELRQMIERPVNELCGQADNTYRKTSRHGDGTGTGTAGRQATVGRPEPAAGTVGGDAGLALRAAAMHAGEYEAFQRIVTTLKDQAPDVAAALGLHP